MRHETVGGNGRVANPYPDRAVRSVPDSPASLAVQAGARAWEREFQRAWHAMDEPRRCRERASAAFLHAVVTDPAVREALEECALVGLHKVDCWSLEDDHEDCRELTRPVVAAVLSALDPTPDAREKGLAQ